MRSKLQGLLENYEGKRQSPMAGGRDLLKLVASLRVYVLALSIRFEQWL